MQIASCDDRLLVGVLGNRNSGKSHRWNKLFGSTARRGMKAPLSRIASWRVGELTF